MCLNTRGVASGEANRVQKMEKGDLQWPLKLAYFAMTTLILLKTPIVYRHCQKNTIYLATGGRLWVSLPSAPPKSTIATEFKIRQSV